MSRVAAACFWASAASAAWVLGGYPLSLALRPRQPWRTEQRAPLPTVTIIVPAYRERQALARKLAALADLDYPGDLLDVIVAADEDDELVEIAHRARPGARVMFSAQRQGKGAGLNRALTRAGGEIVVLTDANNLIAPGALRAAVRHFADPAIVAVAGRRGESGSAYARYEDLVRRLEARSGNVAGISGELIFVRQDRVPRFPHDIVNDDFWLLCELVRRGGRVVYEPLAASSEPALPPREDLARRARISAGRVATVSGLHTLPPGFALRVASHKLGRLALGPLLASALLSSIWLARVAAGYRAAAAAQLCIYVPGALSVAGVNMPRVVRPAARVGRELLIACAGGMVGVARGLRGRQSALWDPVR